MIGWPRISIKPYASYLSGFGYKLLGLTEVQATKVGTWQSIRDIDIRIFITRVGPHQPM